MKWIWKNTLETTRLFADFCWSGVWVFGFNKLLICFGILLNELLVEFVLFKTSTQFINGHKQHWVLNGSVQTDGDGHSVSRSTVGLCLGRIRCAVPPADLQARVGFLGFFEQVFQGCHWLASLEQQRFILEEICPSLPADPRNGLSACL